LNRQSGSTEVAGQSKECPIRTILVPTDFSPAAVKALERAVALAGQCGAVLTILHVVDINAPAQWETAAHLMQRLWTEGSAQMAQVAASLDGRAMAQTMVQEGLPVEEIVERSRGFDLVVLGRSRDQGRLKLFSKRTAQRVSKRAACPVMVV
jgi:nucleotide-binding universal stress UspA family protein